jgi:hypothetical protein
VGLGAGHRALTGAPAASIVVAVLMPPSAPR